MHKSTRKWLSSLALVSISSLVIAGCGSQGSTNSSNSSNSSSTDNPGKQKTIAYLVPSMQPRYFQWVEYGMNEIAPKDGFKVVIYDSKNSTAQQASNVRTALTQGVSAIVLSPVSSTSVEDVLNPAQSAHVPVAFAAIGPPSNVTNYTSAVTSQDLTSGYQGGKYLAQLVKKAGGNQIGVLSLMQDRVNAQNKLKGLKKALKQEGVSIAEMLQTHGDTINEAVTQANDILTAHPNIKGLYCMSDNMGIGAVKALQSRGLLGKVFVVSSDGSPQTISDLKKGYISGIVLQEAVGQGIEATKQVIDALENKPTTKNDPLPEPLITKATLNTSTVQSELRLVYPPTAGSY
ncbi:substrate-binding domain-containing protein [Alicyclobacillus tolerans]|uniref:substrate-binding domain-containing protein n=1 Tax=Alicyclobacillus tolerans TaxID=90970 RepID=UPI001F2C8DB1|nr:substrate-binding domain-containing protein [Alicyclobacillus tolerans]MCF8568115.1 substrate-binding domain-containing protein [Alicyclobacillus tolerans]